MTLFPLQIVTLTGLGFLLYQGLPPALPESTGLLGQIERITLTSALVLAVAVLWKTLSRKDEQLITATSEMQKALVTNAESIRSMLESHKDIAETNRESLRDLSETIKSLQLVITSLTTAVGRLPCTHDGK